MGFLSSAAIAALSLSSAAYAQLSKKCPTSDLCYQLNIPSATASSGKGDIFFQISCATSYSWCALGQGSSMSGANIFVIYTDPSGTNVTLSPRLGSGHVEPQADTAAQVFLLEGTGVSGGMMTANVRCSNCNSWSGGTMDFTQSSGGWITAAYQGSAIASSDLSAAISQHESSLAAAFTYDFSGAKGGNDVNPFSNNAVSSGSAASGSAASGTAAVSCTPTSGSGSASGTSGASSGGSTTLASPSGSGCPTTWPSSWTAGAWPTAASQYSSCLPSGYTTWPTSAPSGSAGNNKRDNSCPAGSAPVSGTSSGGTSSGSTSSSGGSLFGNSVGFDLGSAKGQSILMAHAAMACLAFVLLFPVGGILVRLASFPGLWWIHGLFQLLAYVIYIVGAGLGIYMASNLEMINATHPVIGLFLLAALFFQPILGFLHHRAFGQTGRRTLWSHAHLWLGRAAITLGMVNGALGFGLAGNVGAGRTAYIAIAVIIWVCYVAAVVYGEVRRGKSAPPSYRRSQSFKMQRGDQPSEDSTMADAEEPARREFYGKRQQPAAYDGA